MGYLGRVREVQKCDAGGFCARVGFAGGSFLGYPADLGMVIALCYTELRRVGGMGEWLIPPDCKSGARKGYVGSNPTPSTTTGIDERITSTPS